VSGVSATELRDRAAVQLARVLAREKLDNPWSDRPGTSTRALYSVADLYDPDRLELHDALIEEQLAVGSVPTGDSMLVVVVTAGPPGAGKSTAVARHPEFADFRDIDADHFKDALLVRARDDGLLDGWTSEPLADGRPVAPRELATFVHAESTVLAAAFRGRAFERGENVMIHGTLADPQVIDDLLAAFDVAGYDRLIIVDVEVPLAVATERALSRWWEVREADVDPLGGRFVPPRAIAAYYPADPEVSITRGNADELARRADALDWDVTLERVEL
jgi:hypothetical protein